MSKGFPCSSAGKESTSNEGDLSSIPGLGRSPGEGKGFPLQYFGLENSMDCIVHGVAESDMRDFHLISSQVMGLLILMRFSGPFNLASLVSRLLLLLWLASVLTHPLELRESHGRLKSCLQETGDREGTYVYLWLIHVDVWQTTKFCKAVILQPKNK